MEILSIHSGQAGTSLGLSCWDHFLSEHYLLPDGNMNPDNPAYNEILEYNTFFEEKKNGTYRPRALFVDCVADNLAKLRRDGRECTYGADQIVAGNESTCHIYARGYDFAGNKIIDKTMDTLRLMAEECDCLQGFIFYRSLGGGTGTGFTSLLSKSLKDCFDKKNIHEYSILPGSHPSSSAVEIYNTVLSVINSLKHANMSFMFDNNILFNICKQKLNIFDPTNVHLNMVLARLISSVSASLRFQSALNVTMEDYQSSLVPRPSLCFPLVSFAPILPSSESKELSVLDITKACFSEESQLLNISLKQGLYISSCLMYSGNVRTAEASKTLNAIQKSKYINFVDWCPAIFKAGFNHRPTRLYPSNILAKTKKQLCIITNTTEMSEIFNEMRRNFLKIFKKKGFLHLYFREGMEENDFIEAEEKLHFLELEYLNPRHGITLY